MDDFPGGKDFCIPMLNCLEASSELQIKNSPVLKGMYNLWIFWTHTWNYETREQMCVINFCTTFIKYYIYNRGALVVFFQNDPPL